MDQLQLDKLTNTCLQLFYAVAFIVALCSSLHYFIFIRRVQQWKKSNIPFLRPMFLFGHKYFCHMGKYSTAEALNRIYKENEDKDLVAFFMLMTPVIMLKDPKLIQHIFAKNFDKAYQNGFTVLKDDVESQSVILFTSDKREWKNGRAIMAPAFSVSKLYGGPEFAKIKKQVDKLLRYAEKFEEQPMNVDEATNNFHIDSISLWGFGQEIDSFQKKGEIHEIVRVSTTPSYITLIKLLILTHFPALQVFDMFRFVGQKQKNFLTNLLTEQMEQRDEHTLNHNDLIDHFISLKQKGFSRISMENVDDLMQKNEALSMRRLIGYSGSLLFPGAQTPALVATYTLHLLSLHSEYQERIKREIDEIMIKHQVTKLTSEVVKDLHFTRQCVLETERLYPPPHFLMRRCTDDIQIPGASFSLKKGDRVFASPYSIHRDPKYFQNPDRFDPERFSLQNRGSISPETFLAFGIGPKKCPAYELGNFITITFVAALLHKYEIRPHSHLRQMDAMDLDPRSFFNHHKGVLLVKLIRRKIITS